MTVIELRTDAELKEAFPVMQELRQHLTEETYFELLRPMMSRGYRLFGVRESGAIVALAGITIDTNFYNLRHLWVYDLITSEKVRSKGYGQTLLTHVEQVARDEGCHCIALASGLWRKDAHRFYEERMGYERVSYEFKKTL